MAAEGKKVFIMMSSPSNKNPLFWLWGLVNMEGPLTRPPAPARCELAADLERVRKQQVHIDEIKRLCHVPR